MRPRLIIRLNSNPEGAVHWIRLDADGRVEGHAGSGSLAQAAEAAGQRQVIGLVPAADVLLTHARIPTQSRQRMLRAVPFALEDQLAEEIEALHFALGQRDVDDKVAVAVIAQQKLQAWLAAFSAAGLDVDQLYPEVLALPYEDGAWTVMAEGDTFLVRTSPQGGFAGDLENVEVLLVAALEEAGEARPERLIAYSAEAPLALGAAELPVENRELAHTTALLATSLNDKQALPLRTGAFARRRSLVGINWKRWRVAAALLAGWVLVDTGSAYLEQWRLKRELTTLNGQVEQVFRSVFPGNAPLLNPRQQMEGRLEALRRQGASEGGLLRTLDQVGPVLVGSPGIQLTSLAYRNGNLDLELTAQSLQEIDQLTQRLRAVNGVKVTVRNASAGRNEGERAQGRLTIEVAS